MSLRSVKINLCTLCICIYVLAVAAQPPYTIDTKDEPNIGDGSYSFRYDTSDSIHRSESGYIKKGEDETEILVVKGTYSFVLPNGELRTIEYTADENGYKEKKIESQKQILPPTTTSKPDINPFLLPLLG